MKKILPWVFVIAVVVVVALFSYERGLQRKTLQQSLTRAPVFVGLRTNLTAEQKGILEQHGFQILRADSASEFLGLVPNEEMTRIRSLSFVRFVSDLRTASDVNGEIVLQAYDKDSCTVSHMEYEHPCIEYYPNGKDCKKTRRVCVKVCDDFDVKPSHK